MKFFQLLLFAIVLRDSLSFRKMCRLDILRSFGFHSLIAPNRTNKLCPAIRFNCCTYHDQMRMHKTSNSLKAQIKSFQRLKKYKKGLQKLSRFFGESEMVDLFTLVFYMKKQTLYPEILWDHVKKLTDFLKPLKMKVMVKILKLFKTQHLKKYLK